MTLIFYNIFLSVYYTGLRIASLWNHKARLWVRGRKLFPYIENYNNSATVWMHCASLGEFEQGRPLIEKIKKTYPEDKIIISFFSPSGYERVKDYKGADHIFYLPIDSAKNAREFIALINPTLVLWIKYEYWFYYLHELKKKDIPVLLISGVYRKSMPFFKWYGGLWRKALKSFTHFFIQNNTSAEVLKKIVAVKKITNSGDTRFDRVKEIAENFTPVEGISEFCGTSRVIVAGSTWEDDEAEWVHYVKTHPDIKFIIAPHEIDKSNLKDVKKQFPGSIFYSEWVNRQKAKGNRQETMGKKQFNIQSIETKAPLSEWFGEVNCLIIDNIGMLSRLYKYADITYVGGGFGDDGLHNTLEAAVYGKPVIFGPEYNENFEAEELLECGGAMCIKNAVDLEKLLEKLFTDEEKLKISGEAAKNYVYVNAGATDKIMMFIQENRLLTN